VAEYELFQSLMADSAGHTLVLISHRLSSVKNVDKIFVLEKGRLIEQGTHKELMQDEKRYAEMYKMQAKNYLATEDLNGVLL
jgi:ATP-binding cassette subfamily B protein